MNELIYKENKFYKVKKIFCFTKTKEISKDIVFSSKKNKHIIPKIKGINLDYFLFQKYIYNLKNKKSDFNEKVICNLSNFEVNYLDNSNGFYNGSYTFNGTISTSKDVIAVINSYKGNFSSKFKYTKEYLELLFSLAFSGIYGTAREDEYLVKMMMKDNTEPYSCSICKEKFNNLNELLSHIIETKHKDSIFEQFPYDEELIRVKKFI